MAGLLPSNNPGFELQQPFSVKEGVRCKLLAFCLLLQC